MEITRVGNTSDFPQISKGLSGHASNGTCEVDAEQQNQPAAVKVSKEDLDAAVKKMNEVFDALSTHLKFTFHEGTGKYYVSIVNEVTHETVREIPPKKFLDMVAYFEKQMKGIFVDAKK